MKSSNTSKGRRGLIGLGCCFFLIVSVILGALYTVREGNFHCTCDETFVQNVTELYHASGDESTESVSSDDDGISEDKMTVETGKGYQNLTADQIVFMEAQGVTDTGAFIVDENYTYRCDEPLAAELKNVFSEQSVLELGAGKGQYSRFIQETAKEIHAYDGVPKIEELTGGKVKHADLTNHLKLGLHDWVLCLEVGEHVPEEFELVVINNIHRHNIKGAILSWAVPGQGGFHHVNNKSNRYIKRLFSALGYKNNKELEKKLRKAATLDWFKKTIMVFERSPTSEEETTS